MKAIITLLVMSAIFLYAIFATDHYFGDQWYGTPTIVTLSLLFSFHVVIAVIKSLAIIKQTNKEEQE